MNNGLIRVATDPDQKKSQTMEGVVAGIILLLASLAAAAMVWTRLQVNIDQPTFEEMLAAIHQNILWYNWHGTARIFFGGMLIAFAAMIRPAMPLAQGWLLRWSGLLLTLGGIAIIVSGILVIFISSVFGANIYDVERFDEYRALAASISNTLVGLAIILMTPVQWRLGGAMKLSAIVAPVAGISMVIVWWDTPTIHQISGMSFFVWTVSTAVSLIFGLFEDDSDGEILPVSRVEKY